MAGSPTTEQHPLQLLQHATTSARQASRTARHLGILAGQRRDYADQLGQLVLAVSELAELFTITFPDTTLTPNGDSNAAADGDGGHSPSAAAALALTLPHQLTHHSWQQFGPGQSHRAAHTDMNDAGSRQNAS